MNKELFISILHGVREHDKYFVMMHGFCGLDVFSSIQKCTPTMKMLGWSSYRLHGLVAKWHKHNKRIS
jgi:hypothetical protein